MNIKSVPSLNPEASLEGINITPEQAFVLSRINGTSTLEEIQSIVGFDQAKFQDVMKVLVDFKLVTLPDDQQTKSEKASQKTVTNTLQKRIRNKYEELQKGDHYRMLEVQKGSTEAIIEQAYFRLSKEFHPDRFFSSDLGPFQKMLEEVFNGIQHAHQVLSDPELKKQYFQQSRKRKIKPEKKPPSKPEKPEKKVDYDISTADSQYKMGCKEEERGNLKAAMNFYRMAMMLDSKNETYHEALDRIKKALKNPLNTL